MRKLIRSYFQFTRTEQAGVAGLVLLLAILTTIRISMPYISGHERNLSEEQQLVRKWEEKAAGKAQDVTAGTDMDIPPAENTAPLFMFDPNTLDSAGFRKLGLREKTTSILLHWRAKGKVFYAKEELKRVYTLTDAEYKRMAPYVQIKQQRVDLNTADSAALVRVHGIGPKLAQRILKYRAAHGKFTSHEQLREVYHFSDKVFNRMKEELNIQ